MQMIRAQTACVRVLLGREHANGVPTLSRNFLDQCSGFSMAQQQEIHWALVIYSEGRKNKTD